ncbi:MAG: G8 domain-containing protein, partial [Pseudomonadota bacterium]
MSSSVSNFSKLIADPSVDLQDFLTAAKAANAPGTRRKKSIRQSRNSEVAGTALIAALLGSQFVEDAQAGDDFARARNELGWLRNVRICTGRSHFGLEDRAHVGFGHDSAAATSDFSHEAHGGFSPAGRFQHSSYAIDDGDRVNVRFSHDGHDVRSSAGPRAGTHAHDETTDAATTTDTAQTAGGATTSGHGHTTSGGTTSGSTTTSTTTSSGGHTHTGTTTTTTTTTTGPLPHPTDLAMQKEHIALMNLVPASAATHVAVNNGSWFDPNTWANHQVPGDGAKVLIPQDVTVEYDGKSPASIFTVRVDGEIDFAPDVDTFMEVDTFVVTSTGTLTIGTEANPVAPNVHAVISFADNGPINVAWDPMLLSRGLISHGTVDIHGAEKETFLKVAVDPMKGATTLTLESPPDGWEVGDKLVLTGTHLVSTAGTAKDAPITTPTQDEELIITAINGNVITFDHPLAFDHEGARADLKAYVANYSRNVVFENEGGDTTNVHERGHVMLMHSDNIVVKYAEFDELGRTDKSVRSFDVANLSTVASDSNVRGRYSLHIHRAGVDDAQHPAIVEGNAVWGSPGWGFVHHDSNALFSNNAAYDVFGAAFVAETGNEIGRWDHNIAIKSLGVNHITKDGGDVTSF